MDGDQSKDSSFCDNSLEYEIEEDQKSLMLYSIIDNFPATIFFQYGILEKNFKNTNKTFKLDWNKNSKHCILYKAYKNVPLCITNTMKENGIIRSKSFFKSNLIWKLLKIEKMILLLKKLNKYQKFNHFPSTWQLGRKDNLWRNFKKQRSIHKEAYNYLPETYIIPEDLNELNEALANSKDMWLIKPVASSRGRGIRLLTEDANLPKKCLVSKYINNPHIINNKKYDLRLYIVITDFSPLKIYLFDEGLVRFASE
jgi:hypothetical protein